jgi:hypothetical protein
VLGRGGIAQAVQDPFTHSAPELTVMWVVASEDEGRFAFGVFNLTALSGCRLVNDELGRILKVAVVSKLS